MPPSALHQIDVLNRNRSAIAVKHDQDCKTDGRLRGGDRQDQQRVNLSDDVAEMSREGDQIDVDRQQDQFDRHQNDDDVLAVEENAEDPQCEQDCGDREVMTETDGHAPPPSPWPDRTLTISIDAAGVRATWAPMSWRRTRAR